MKKKFLTLLGGALLGLFSMNASAQTNVTNTYLVNPSFEGSSVRFLDINTDRGVEKPEGWSVEWYQDNNDKNGMTFVAESMTQDSKTWSSSDRRAYFVRMRWANSTIYLRQTLQNLIPGNYTLSFAAVAHTSATDKNALSVSVAGQTKTVNVVSNESGTWNNYDVEFTVADGSPYATIEIKGERNQDLFKFGVDNFVLTYDGSSYYETALEKAQDVYDDNKDWAEGADALQTTITNAGGKTTVDDKNAAIFALIQAVKEFKAANTVDMTSKILNPNFESNIENWTVSGGDGNAFARQTSTQVNFNGGFLEKWRNGWNGGYNQKNLDIQQTILNLPNGEYEIKVAVIAQMQGNKETLGDNYKNKKHGGPYYIDDNHGVWVYGTSGTNSGTAWANTQNPSFTNGAGGEFKTATVKVENGELTIGLKAIGSNNGGAELGTYANWIACDNWTLSYFGFDASGLLADLKSMIPDDYTEKHSAKSETDLQNAIEAAEGLIEAGTATKTDIATASTNLTNAIAAVEASIADYAALHAAIAAASYAVITPSYTALATAITTAQGIYAAATTEDCAEAIEALDAAVKAAKVADYNYVMGYFTEDASLGDWSNTYGTNLITTEGYDTTTGYYDLWSGSATPAISQTVTLPAGEYALIGIGRGQAGQSTEKLSVKIGAGEATTVDFLMKGNTGLGVNTSGQADFTEGDGHAYTRDGAGQGWEYRFILFTLNEESSVTLGANATLSSSWAGVYPLQVKTTAASIKALKITEINALAESAPTGQMQKSVKSTLETKIAAATVASTDNTKEELQTIYNELKAAVDAANASVANYKALNSVIATSNACYNENAEGAATFNTAISAAQTAYTAAETDATSETVTIKSALKTYVDENAIEMVVNGTFDTNKDGWSSNTGASGQNLANNKTGDFTGYFWENWNSSPKTGKMSQKNAAVLPAGDYVLQIAAFGDQAPAYEGSNLYVFVNDQKTAVISDVPTYYYVPFTLTEAAVAGTVEYGLVAESDNKSGWIGIDNVSISYVSGKGNFLATETEYAALTAAITAAEAKTLGFEVGEYAPYNNIDAAKALAAAKAIDQEADNSKDAVEAATTALTSATWTANTEEVNAVYDGSFNLTTKTEGDYTVPTGWTNVGYNTRVYNSSNMGSNAGVSATSKTATMFAKFTTEYGTEAGYTMPLKKGVYYLSFIYGGWNEVGTREIKVYNASKNATVTPSSVTAKDNKAHTTASSWSTYSGLVEIPEDGDYILSFYRESTTSQNQICISDIELKKAASANMTITDVKWGTFVAPFAVTIPEDVEAYEVEGVTNDGTINMKSVETTIPANTPVLVYSESAQDETFYGKAVSGDPATDYLVGVYEPTKAPAGSYILMLHNDKAVFGQVVEGKEPTVGANRCYLNVPSGTSSTILRFGDATGIQSVEQQGETIIYDLTGRRVDAAVKGIYIVNGKKMLVK